MNDLNSVTIFGYCEFKFLNVNLCGNFLTLKYAQKSELFIKSSFLEFLFSFLIIFKVLVKYSYFFLKFSSRSPLNSSSLPPL